jgi:glycosyltransferase involved in cell wall biosynthesis
MKVLYVIDSIFPGGAARSLAAMVPSMVSSGVDLEVVYLLERPGLREPLKEAGARVTALSGSTRATWWAQATRIARLRRPDLIHTTLIEADLAGRIAGFLAGVPVVSSLVNLAYGPEQLRNPRLARWKVEAARLADAVTARGVARFHAISSDVAQVMGRRLRIHPDRIDVIPRGRDPEELGRRDEARRQRVRRQLGIEPSQPVILAAARQEYQKGLDVLLDAFPLVRREQPSAHILLAGRLGAASEELDRRAAKLGPTVQMLGARQDVPDLLCAADVFILPSRWEGLGGVLLEAMALEAPIVASDLPAVRETLGNGRHALLVPPDRPPALAKAILSALSNREDTDKQAQAARQRYLEEYTVDAVVPRMLAFYERSLSRARRRRLLTGGRR